MMQANYPPNVWTHSIAFYLDGVSFVCKANSTKPVLLKEEYGEENQKGLHEGKVK